jgi:hypothetical protein
LDFVVMGITTFSLKEQGPRPPRPDTLNPAAPIAIYREAV